VSSVINVLIQQQQKKFLDALLPSGRWKFVSLFLSFHPPALIFDVIIVERRTGSEAASLSVWPSAISWTKEKIFEYYDLKSKMGKTATKTTLPVPVEKTRRMSVATSAID
jgi:hypothetical protein